MYGVRRHCPGLLASVDKFDDHLDRIRLLFCNDFSGASLVLLEGSSAIASSRALLRSEGTSPFIGVTLLLLLLVLRTSLPSSDDVRRTAQSSNVTSGLGKSPSPQIQRRHLTVQTSSSTQTRQLFLFLFLFHLEQKRIPLARHILRSRPKGFDANSHLLSHAHSSFATISSRCILSKSSWRRSTSSSNSILSRFV
jgi:hypothetical protein